MQAPERHPTGGRILGRTAPKLGRNLESHHVTGLSSKIGANRPGRYLAPDIMNYHGQVIWHAFIITRKIGVDYCAD